MGGGTGPLADRYGMKPPLVVGPVVEGLGLLAVALASSYAGLAALSARRSSPESVRQLGGTPPPR